MEEWRSIPGYEGRYEASSLGRVRSLDRVQQFTRAGKPAQRRIKGRVLSASPNVDGYPHVPLRIAGKLRLITAHRLVCLAFHGKPNVLHNEVAHLDNDRGNAAAGNLRWVSKVENRSHRKIHGTECHGEKHGNAKLTTPGVIEIKSRLRRGESQSVLAREFGVTPAAVRSIARGQNWRHVH